ncbi:hypothetical protein [uncultured Parabacteroides sp.]|jgi:hypothetical protein|uniref:hypothetical protein n=1 Tax=uncultured Parabacteroides sp. TaxID=512312 RepID=UPI0025FD40E5|nr:hypothetical protein [uncultured Parabacteroides sp.]
MKKQQTFHSTALRFRRWSRKKYAAFISIQRAVTIGQLSSNVSERFQTKNGSIHSSVLFADQTVKEEKEDASELFPERTFAVLPWLSQVLFLLFSVQTVKQTSSADSSAYINNLYFLKRKVSV